MAISLIRNEKKNTNGTLRLVAKFNDKNIFHLTISAVPLVRRDRHQHLPEEGLHAVHGQLQGARRSVHVDHDVRRGEAERSHFSFSRKSRPRSSLSRTTTG